MKTTLKLLFAFAITLSFSACSIFKAGSYAKFYDKNGIEVNHIWYHPKDTSKPSQLRLEVRNTSQTDKQVSFKVQFYDAGIISEESEIVSICLRPGTKVTGKANGVYFQSENIKKEQVEKEGFSWDLGSLEIEDTTCK